MDREAIGSPEMYKVNTPVAMSEIATLNAQLQLEAPDNIPAEEKIAPPESAEANISPRNVSSEVEQVEEANRTTVLDRIRGTKLGRAAALAGTVIALAGASSMAKDVITPSKTQAAVECTTETTTLPDGTITSSKQCTHVEDDATGEVVQHPADPKPPKSNNGNKNNPNSGDSIKQPKNPKPKREKWPVGFVNYDQGDWPYPSTGCGPTAYGMVAATLKGNRRITPASISRSISPRWYNPGVTGTAPEAFFAMGKRHGLKVKEFDGAARFQQAKKALKKGGLAIIHAVPGSGYFTQAGHYLVLKRLQGNKFRIADPNGRGRQGNSESRSWSSKALKKRGIGSIWTFQKKR